MTTKRRSAKKWLLGVTAVTAAYFGLWFVTDTFGVPQVRSVAVKAMEQPVHYSDAAEPSDHYMEGPVYRCSAGAYAPFLVRADHRWQYGEAGESGRSHYLWLFGRTFRIGQVRHAAL